MALDIKAIIDIQGIKSGVDFSNAIDKSINLTGLKRNLEDINRQFARGLADSINALNDIKIKGIDVSPQLRATHNALELLKTDFKDVASDAIGVVDAIVSLKTRIDQLGKGTSLDSVAADISSITLELQRAFEAKGLGPNEALINAKEIIDPEVPRIITAFFRNQVKEAQNASAQIIDIEKKKQEQLRLINTPQNIRNDQAGRSGNVLGDPLEAKRFADAARSREVDAAFRIQQTQENENSVLIARRAARQRLEQEDAASNDAFRRVLAERLQIVEAEVSSEITLRNTLATNLRRIARETARDRDQLDRRIETLTGQQTAGIDRRREITQSRAVAAAARYEAEQRNAVVAADQAAFRIQSRNLNQLRTLYNQLNGEITSTQNTLAKTGERNSEQLQQLLRQRQELGGFLGGGRIGGPPGGPPGGGPPNGPPPDPRNIRTLLETAKAQRRLREETLRSASAMFQFGEQAALAFRRYAAFLVGTKLTFAISGAVREAGQEFLKFEEQLTKLEQISEASKAEITALGDTFLALGQKTGLSASEITKATQTLAQAGFGKAEDVPQLKKFAEQIAKVPLAATFGSIEETTDGLIAIFGQFNKTLDDTGTIFDTVNQFANDFAIESKDIFEIIKRGGSVFATAGGSLQEIIELGSLVRSSTRLSAESVGTFFKTGFAQLLSGKSQAALKGLGIETGNVVDQMKQLAGVFASGKLSELEKINFAGDLVGNRQIGPLLALLRELAKQKEQAKLTSARANTAGSLDRAVAKRLDDVGVSLERIKRNVESFFITLVNNDGIKKFVKDIADLTTNLKNLIGVLAPALPLITALTAVVGLKGIGQLALGFGTKLGITSRFGKAGNAISDFAENRRNDRILSGAIPKASFVGPRSTQDLENIALRADLRNRRRPLRRAGLAIGAAGGLFAAGLIGTSIGDELAASPNANEARRGRGISNVFGGLSAGAGIGFSLAGPAGAAVGAALGAFAGALKEATDRVKEFKDKEFKKSLGFAGDDPFQKLQIAEAELIRNAFDSSGFLGLGKGLPKGGREGLTKKALEDLGTDKSDAGQLLTSSVQQVFTEEKEKLLKNLDTSQITDPAALKTIQEDLQGQLLKNAAERISEGLQKNISVGDAVDVLGLVAQRGAVTSISAQDVHPEKVLQNFVDELANALDFSKEADQINKAFRHFADGLIGVFENINQDSTRLESVILDTQASNKAFLPQGEKNQLKAFGFNQLADFQTETENIAKDIGSFLDNPKNLANARRAIDLAKEGSQETEPSKKSEQFGIFKKILTPKASDEKSLRAFLDAVGKLAGESNKNVYDTAKEIIDNAGKGTLSGVKALRGKQETIDEALKSGQADFESFNRLQDSIAQLGDSIRNLGSACQEVENKVFDLNSALEDRLGSQVDFLENDSNQIASKQRAAERDRVVASTAVNPSQAFAASFDVVAARKRLNATSSNLIATNSSTTASTDDREAARTANDVARAAFLDAQTSFTNQLSRFDTAVAAATARTESLRSAFKEFDGQLQATGAALSGLTVKDLRRSFQALDKFNAVGSEGLTDQESTSLDSLLKLVSDFKLPGLQSGTDILRKRQEDLAIPALAGFSSRQNGLSQTENEKLIRDTFVQMRADADAAFDAEKKLKEKQKILVDAQAAVLILEKGFYEREKASLAVDTGATPIQQIRDLLENTFGPGKPILVQLAGTSGQGGQPNIGGYTPPSQVQVTQQDLVNQQNIVKGFNSSLLLINSSFESIASSVRAYTDVLEKLIAQSRTEATARNVAATLEISPIQVNIALTAPDILKLAGGQIYKAVIAKIAPALSQAFGVISPEARNSFDSNIPRE